MGRPVRGHVLLTKTLLMVGQEGTTQRVGAAQRGFAMVADFAIDDPKLTAYDKKTGQVVGEVALPRNATGAPMTYQAGRAAVRGGPHRRLEPPAELVALRLP